MADIMRGASSELAAIATNRIPETTSQPVTAHQEMDMNLRPASSVQSSATTPPSSPPTRPASTKPEAAPEIPISSSKVLRTALELRFENWTEGKERVVMAPYDYIASSPGKEFRTLLLEAFNEYLQIPTDHLHTIQNVVRMLHTSSLLIDDIQDNSVLRRGLPVSHSIFGPAQTINSANYVYFLALEELQRLPGPHVADIFVSELLRLHRGQAMDLFWRDTLTCPTEADYLEMVSNKTGGLFRLAYRLMKAESSASVDLLPLVEVLGLIYQIADDYKNLCDGEYSQKKGFGEDLAEGKFSFPVIRSMHVDADNHEILHILQQKPTSDEVKRYAVSLMERLGSLEYTRDAIKQLVCWAHKLLDEADQVSGKCPSLRQVLVRLSDV